MGAWTWSFEPNTERVSARLRLVWELGVLASCCWQVTTMSELKGFRHLGKTTSKRRGQIVHHKAGQPCLWARYIDQPGWGIYNLPFPNRIAFLHQPVQVFAHSICFASFPYLWWSSQLRREPIIVAHLLLAPERHILNFYVFRQSWLCLSHESSCIAVNVMSFVRCFVTQCI